MVYASKMWECPERQTVIASKDEFWALSFLLHAASRTRRASIKVFEAIFGSSRQSRKTRNLDSDALYGIRTNMIYRKLEHAMSRTFMGSVVLFPPMLVIILPQQFVLSEGLQRQWRIPRSKKDVNLKISCRICAKTMYCVLASSMQGTAANLGTCKRVSQQFRSAGISHLPFDPVHESLAGTILDFIMRG
ncbi:uncharacterized protein ARMOST_11421 [Armillaria ostoyae]|uniref:Uncharacterized protein n=1 Tax=Armillaria ostoyae TaxID=47428 RepID=A0A284RH33_ARMOS|nr:uncharacterized protein ARMOST_11421 [Armillaria ostoyae]